MFVGQVMNSTVGVARQNGPETAMRPAIPPPGTPSIDGRVQGVSDADAKEEAARMGRIAAKERHKKITADTTKMVRLATDVNLAVGQPDLKETPPDAIHKTEEIEKLAHDLQVRMKS